MIILSEAAANAALNAIGAMLNGGAIELLSGEGTTLAVMKLGTPATRAAEGGALEFRPIAEEDAAPAAGQATTARILAADGTELFLADVGNANSDAVIKFRSVEIRRGDPVRIGEFRLRMP